ncbi:hypothetical protein DNK06_10870 [Pseudomonas daroniae]|uniref:Uncharacterized protein n=1 Tax=Phytopseudomonas daroniae TaxID=2487519 RepID=A0A4Q9QPA3_9GAMM|nr:MULTISPECIES: hypothetical protein [Pseudomonas]TBU76165.1 hypothetical protein DNK10_09325 [Pseudomonas daroniae]TBU80268.1 hypothetical protein DNK06_10870 [Pseudomonas daroniae]TBU85302.1 hypothetical protein DNK31_02880 [Pseudomonas sp. FRB 228]TBU94149.1 hypothetical protein DNJ99_02880 [Pseudomonas daroniae]
MRNVAVVLTLCAVLGGCAGGGSPRDEACRVLSPAEIDLPTTRDEPRIEGQSTGDPTPPVGEQNC